MRIIIMLTKKIQITEKTTISLARCNEETLGVDVIRFYFKEELVGVYIASAMEQKAAVCLYELVERTARHETEAFLLSCTTQKSLLHTLKGLKAIREDISEADKAIFNVFLKAFDAN